jgi:hypothetical protein
MMAEPDLTFLTRRLERLQTDVAAMRDEMHVSGAMQRRTDGLVVSLIEEIRAVHDVLGRVLDRLGKIEGKIDAALEGRP